jgi:hypothetical protein
VAKKSIARSVPFFPPIARQLAAYERVMTLQQLAPPPVAQLRSTGGGADDVSEEHGGEDRLGYRRGLLAGDEALDLVGNLRREVDAPVVVAGDAHGASSADPPGNIESVRLGEGRTMEDERRHAHRREDLAKVGLEPGAVQRVRDRGARAHAKPVRKPLPFVGINSDGWLGLLEELVGVLLRSPRIAKPREVLPRSFRITLGIVRDRVEQNERPRPFGVRRRVENGHRATVVGSEKHGAGRPDGVEYGADVVHPRLERRKLSAQVREPGAALVEEDQPETLGKALVERTPVPGLPCIDEVRDVVRDVEKVDIPVADHLVRDRDAAAAHVANVEAHAQQSPRLATWQQPRSRGSF